VIIASGARGQASQDEDPSGIRPQRLQGFVRHAGYMDHQTSSPVSPMQAPWAQDSPTVREPLDWDALYTELGESVFRMFHRMLGHRAQAEDLTHDTFIRVHEAREQYDGRGSPAAWVFRIAGNLARDTLRQRRMRNSRLHLLAAGSPAHEGVDPAVTLSLRDALGQLEPAQRAIVLLHDVDGYSHREIAEMLGIREGTSRARLSHARALLRKSIGPIQER